MTSKTSSFHKDIHTNKRKAFSVAEATIALLIGSVALGMAAPMITKQIKTQNFADTERRLMNQRIDNVFPKNSVMFFNSRTCPDGWKPLVDSEGVQYDGYYPRIGAEGSSEIGTIKEQMVHKHKHVSPFMAYMGLPMINQHRYGPYSFPGRLWVSTFNRNVIGDGTYPTLTLYKDGNGNFVPASSSIDSHPVSFFGVGYPGTFNYNTITYTSDGMNREEGLFGISRSADSVSGYNIKPLTVCPNRDEDNEICKPSGNRYDIPYLEEMPLVGDENRPNSIVLLACQRGN